MEILVAPGKYVAAVSGGVDSMVLLDMLAHCPGVEVIVAHFDHGIRPDSGEDCRFVEAAAQRYGLPFIYEAGRLGSDASEAEARVARYAFLRQVCAEQGAGAIITGHHQDDVIETAIINLARGTGRRGLSSLRSGGGVLRPLLQVPKTTLVAYAREQGIASREDATNQDERYLRNYIRRRVVPRMSAAQRAEFLHIISRAAVLNHEIDGLLGAWVREEQLPRTWFIMLPHAVAGEVMVAWLRQHSARFDRRRLAHLVVFAKTAARHKAADVDAAHRLHIGKEHIILLADPSNP